MKVVIVGAGLIGCERIKAVKYISENIDNTVNIIGVFDINEQALLKVKEKYQVPTFDKIQDALNLKPDWVFIATPNSVAKQVAKQAFDIGANVLMEKPFGRSFEECQEIINSKPPECQLYIGFNYRFFAGVEALLNDVKNNKFGNIISVNLTLAHGNSPGMEKSWRFQPNAGGDCTIDLGVHLFDIILQLSSAELILDFAKTWQGFWNTGIDEETHIMAHDSNNTIFNLQVSLNRWRNTFKIEVNGTEGYGIVEGRGGNYGPQSYKTGIRWGWLSGKSQSETESVIVNEHDCKDSFIKETMSMLKLGDKSTSHTCNFQEAKEVMKLLDQYQKFMEFYV